MFPLFHLFYLFYLFHLPWFTAPFFFSLPSTIVNDLLAKYNLLDRNFNQLKTLYVRHETIKRLVCVGVLFSGGGWKDQY